MNQINWGIIGCGDVTEVKSGPAFNQIKDSCLVAVTRRNAEKAEDYALRHNVSKWYNKAEDLINDPEVNAVYVATPPDSHAEYTIKALEAGKPVYVEKPMARNYSECLQMIETSKKFNKLLFVAYYRRKLPGFEKVKEIIEKGLIGKVFFVNVNLLLPPRNEDFINGTTPWRLNNEVMAGGYFSDMASHQLDFFNYLLGEFESVESFKTNRGGFYNIEDTFSVIIKYKSGVLLNGSWCFVVRDEFKNDQSEIIGSKGKIVFSTFDFVPVRLETITGVNNFIFERPKYIQQDLIKTVVDELLNRGKSPSTGFTAAQTNLLIDKILREC